MGIYIIPLMNVTVIEAVLKHACFAHARVFPNKIRINHKISAGIPSTISRKLIELHGATVSESPGSCDLPSVPSPSQTGTEASERAAVKVLVHRGQTLMCLIMFEMTEECQETLPCSQEW